MIKVKATAEYQNRNMTDGVLGRVPRSNEIFEVSEERFELLNGNNMYNAVFVEKVEEPIVETAKIEPKIEKAVKPIKKAVKKVTKKAKK